MHILWAMYENHLLHHHHHVQPAIHHLHPSSKCFCPKTSDKYWKALSPSIPSPTHNHLHEFSSFIIKRYVAVAAVGAVYAARLCYCWCSMDNERNAIICGSSPSHPNESPCTLLFSIDLEWATVQVRHNKHSISWSICLSYLHGNNKISNPKLSAHHSFPGMQNWHYVFIFKNNQRINRNSYYTIYQLKCIVIA